MARERRCQNQKDNSMKLGTVLGYSGADMSLPIDRVLEAERLGFGSASCCFCSSRTGGSASSS